MDVAILWEETVTTTSGEETVPTQGSHAGWRRLWDRELHHYPESGPRVWYLALTVLATVVLYYALVVPAAIAPRVMQHFGFTFAQITWVVVIGGVAGAFASLAAGLADRWGRANLVVGGLLVTGLLMVFALPNASSKAEYTVFIAMVSMVEGVVLVATPALVRDFSPQLNRGAAMGFWTLGPVLGSLLTTEVTSSTLHSHPGWQFQFRLCGVIGLAVCGIALLGLRELSPQLRDQLMVSIRDRALVEARAARIDPEKLVRHHWRQMLKVDVIGPALGVSLGLLTYLAFIGLVVTYFVSVFNYSEARANGLATWYWIADAIALIVAGVASDRLRVRKPFILVGTVIALVGGALFAAAATKPSTTYGTFALYCVVMALGGGIAFVAWMAAFTETVERHNPAGTAAGLAIWVWTLRIVATVTTLIVPAVVPATTALIDNGPRVQQIVATYPTQARVLQTVDRATLATLSRKPNDPVAQARALAELSGLPIASVSKTATLGATYRQELITSAALSPATKAALAKAPTSPQLLQLAVSELTRKLHIPPPAAVARLRSLAKVPPASLAFLTVNAPKAQQAAARLSSLSTIPRADLAYLQAHGAKVAKAKNDAPGQWQTWWWICFVGGVAFIPLACLLKGRWDPRRARQDAREHEQMVERELAQLQAERGRSDEVVRVSA